MEEVRVNTIVGENAHIVDTTSYIWRIVVVSEGSKHLEAKGESTIILLDIASGIGWLCNCNELKHLCQRMMPWSDEVM
jgi:hypothetical protein